MPGCTSVLLSNSCPTGLLSSKEPNPSKILTGCTRRGFVLQHVIPARGSASRGRRDFQRLAATENPKEGKPSNSILDVDFQTSDLAEELSNFEDFGKRGEALLLGQAILLAACAFPPQALNPLAQLCGVGLIASGFGLIYFGSIDLGASLSPLPKPREGNTLRTTGIYSVCRHPMYSGLLVGSVGAALLDPSPARSLFVVALALLLNSKAVLEEEELAKIHPSYNDYKEMAPRLLPDVPALVKLIKERVSSS
mmetsp:Transcript_15111/g.42339  ORF Transcript_15111/g.42339 Transcript_15111/m.42339 type:complete len:252 (+) Transcript_15111:172-927(+)|eukprot:CAMPEP_0117671212 /NCGR_PEP_ID=MMETSP0804-20121206/13202_1 /TAXON_ID=1074897 /ORGANISM="Tetraselmis astigmatica, Strain CCMP880" /LENGTH=251 /DNA_ID=CAMNT_0005479635 /DNA_START=94 /DNA_END=849 /DNA_ORIENTATION=+